MGLGIISALDAWWAGFLNIARISNNGALAVSIHGVVVIDNCNLISTVAFFNSLRKLVASISNGMAERLSAINFNFSVLAKFNVNTVIWAFFYDWSIIIASINGILTIYELAKSWLGSLVHLLDARNTSPLPVITAAIFDFIISICSFIDSAF